MKTDTRLFPNSSINEAIHHYSVEKSTPVSSNLDIHREESEKWTVENSGMAALFVHPLQSQFLAWFPKLLGVKKVLEIGCYTGCSALAFAEALKGVPGSEITTLDLPGKHSDFARASFQKHCPDSGPKITLIEGRAADTLPTLAGNQYDLVFIDADKPGYSTYLDLILDLDLLPVGGVLLVDNALWGGLVADSSDNNPNREEPDYGDKPIAFAKAIDDFNKKVLADPRLDSIILPVFDGINFVRRKK